MTKPSEMTNVGLLAAFAADRATWPNSQWNQEIKEELLRRLAAFQPVSGNGTEPPDWTKEFLEHIQWMHDHAHERIGQTNDSGVMKGYRCIPADSHLNAYLQGQRDTATELMARAREFKKVAGAASHNGQGWVRVPSELALRMWSERIACAALGPADARDREGRKQVAGYVLGQLEEFAKEYCALPAPPSEADGPQVGKDFITDKTDEYDERSKP